MKHAIQLKPSLGRTHQWLGILYSMQGRHEEAIACLERARETDPECPWYAGFQALCFYYAHDYQRALELLDVAARENSNAFQEEVRALCLLQLRDVVRAEAAARRALEVSGGSPRALGVLACVLYDAHRAGEAREIRQQLRGATDREYVSPYVVALVAAAADERKHAADSIARGVRTGDWWTLWSRTEPRFDALRQVHAFQNAMRPLNATTTAPVHAVAASRRQWIWTATPVLAFVAALLAWLFLHHEPPLSQLHLRKLTMNGTAAHAAISRDGKYAAYSLHEGILQSLWLRQVGAPAAVRVTPPLDAELTRLAFSGDGTMLTFVAAQRNDVGKSALLQVPVLGGPIRRLRENLAGPASISEDGQYLALIEANAAKRRDELHVSKVDGSQDRILWTREYPDHFAFPSTPSWSRDGKRILCAMEGSDVQGYYNYPVSIDIDGRGRKVLRDRRWQYIEQATWTGDGRGAMVIGREKDSSFLHIWYLPYGWGQARQLTNDLADYSGLTITADSKAMLAVQYQTLASVFVARAGHPDQASQITPGGGRYFDLRWTRQGKILYSSDASGAAEIWMMDADGGGQHALTSGPGRSYAPAASPSGDAVVFHSNRTGSWNIWRTTLDGGSLAQLTFGPQDSNWPQVTPDGKWVVYHHTGAEAMWNIFRVPLDGGTPQQLSRKLTTLPAVSPVDGKVACWYSDDAARPNIKIAIFRPEGGEPIQLLDVDKTVSTDSALRWTPDGKAITFIDYHEGGGNVCLQRLDGSPEQALTHFKRGMIYSFDWAPDGRLALSQGTSTGDVVLLTDARK
ncbi:MAG: PD40 domain-containing protein [Acidobacteriaceae bacterium]|nr:PD40 domain-containing protein [Acidobacteriaceae bacterium]